MSKPKRAHHTNLKWLSSSHTDMEIKPTPDASPSASRWVQTFPCTIIYVLLVVILSVICLRVRVSFFDLCYYLCLQQHIHVMNDVWCRVFLIVFVSILLRDPDRSLLSICAITKPHFYDLSTTPCKYQKKLHESLMLWENDVNGT